jgi:hypothetical protein
MHIDMGDYLTFGSIARGLGLLNEPEIKTLERCEIERGVMRRHPDMGPDQFRSDISRDGYIGHLFYCLTLPRYERNKKLSDVLYAIWKHRGQVGERGEKGYTNIWPLTFIYLSARFGAWIPTPPPIATPTQYTGFRSHLLAIYILIEYIIGKRRWIHKYSTDKILGHNPKNPWFYALYCLVHREHCYRHEFNNMMDALPDNGEASTGWGSCPDPVLKGLARFTKGLCE